MSAVRGASRLARPAKAYGFCSKRKRFALQTTRFRGVLNSYKIKTRAKRLCVLRGSLNIFHLLCKALLKDRDRLIHLFFRDDKGRNEAKHVGARRDDQPLRGGPFPGYRDRLGSG